MILAKVFIVIFVLLLTKNIGVNATEENKKKEDSVAKKGWWFLKVLTNLTSANSRVDIDNFAKQALDLASGGKIEAVLELIKQFSTESTSKIDGLIDRSDQFKEVNYENVFQVISSPRSMIFYLYMMHWKTKTCKGWNFVWYCYWSRGSCRNDCRRNSSNPCRQRSCWETS